MAKRTIRRKVRKNKTIRKVMRGCNRRGRRKIGGNATIQAHQYPGGGAANQNIATGTQHLMQAQQNAGNVAPPIPPPRQLSLGSSPSPQQGGRKTRHHKQKLRYKKSLARKSRHA